MFRPLVATVAALALTAVAGCASNAAPAAVPHSYAAQVPARRVADAPPTDFEFDFSPTDTRAEHRFTHDAPLTGSLHADSATKHE